MMRSLKLAETRILIQKGNVMVVTAGCLRHNYRVHRSSGCLIIITFLMSVNAGGMRELSMFASTNVLTAQYMLPTRAGRRTGIDIQSFIGRFWDAFVNIDITTPKGCSTTVDVLVYKYVVIMMIS